MNAVLIRSQFRDMLRHPGRVLLTGLSVLIAAFVVLGSVIAYQIVTRTTLDAFGDTPSGVDLVVSTNGTMLTGRDLAAVRKTPGVDQTTGRLTTTLTVGDASAGISLDLIADPGSGPLSSITLVSGTYPAHRDEIALDRRAAERLGAQPGTVLRLRNGDARAAPVKATVTSIVDGRTGGNERGYAPDTTVARFAGEPGYPRLDLTVTPGAAPDAVLTSLGDALSADPASAFGSITTGAVTRVNEAKAAVRQFDQIFALVGMFIAVAVLAAAMVATSTFRIVFAQRLRQLALLRVIGAQSGQLVRTLLAEGALVGLISGAAGVVLAAVAGLAAPGIAAAAGRTISAPDVPVTAGLTVVIGAGLLTMGAVLAPALSAAGVAPLQALRDAGVNAAERGISAGRLLIGMALAAATAVLVWRSVDGLPQPGDQDYRSSDILLSLVGAAACAFGMLVVLGPVLIRPVLAVIGWPVRALGPAGRLAVGAVGGQPRRAAAVTVVVALGVALVAGTVVGIESLRAYTDQAMAARVPADLAMFAKDKPIGEGVLIRLRQDPRFRHVTSARLAEFTNGQLSYTAIDIDMRALPTLQTLQAANGDLAALAPGKAILAHTLAEDLHAAVGDTVTLRNVRVEVVAILTGDAPLRAGAVLDPAALTELGATQTVVLADVAGGPRTEALTAFRAVGNPFGAEVAVLADERDKADDEISSLFAAALGLLGLTVLIAVTGVGTTTGLSVLERTRESGLLRALGLSKPRLRLMIGLESGLYGLIGAVLGTVLGVPASWLALEALNLDVPVVFPTGRLLLIAAALTVITVLAGLLPARRAARVSPVAALANGE